VKKIQCLTKRGRVILCLLLAMAAILPASCGRRTDRKPLFPVTGKLVDGDKPAEKAVMFFQPLDGSGSGRLLPVGKVAADGSFRVSTYMADDGAPVGEYAVTVVWPKIPKGAPADEVEGPDQLKGRCSNPKVSPWHFRVEEKANNLGTLDLQSWPAATTPETQAPGEQKAPAGAVE
jgi:hypothetical protein